MKIVIPGGTGQVGSVLSRALRARRHDVVVLSRGGTSDARVVPWDGRTVGAWTSEVDGADVDLATAWVQTPVTGGVAVEEPLRRKPGRIRPVQRIHVQAPGHDDRVRSFSDGQALELDVLAGATGQIGNRGTQPQRLADHGASVRERVD
jgi:uncharacterized protein YbjT (DUF2867 family)